MLAGLASHTCKADMVRLTIPCALACAEGVVCLEMKEVPACLASKVWFAKQGWLCWTTSAAGDVSPSRLAWLTKQDG